MAYPSTRTYPGPWTFPGVQSDPQIVDVAPPRLTVDDLLSGSRRLLRRVTVLRDREPLLVDGAPVRLPVTGGSISVRDGLPTRELSGLGVVGAQWLPTMPRDVLHPQSGHELLVEVGIAHRDVGQLWWPLGVFDVGAGEVEVSDDGPPSLSLSAPDRATRVSGALMLTGYRVAAGTPSESAVLAIVAATGAGVPVELTGIGGLVGTALLVGEPGKDPLAAAGEALAKPKGVDIRVGPDGAIHLVAVRDPALTDPQWTWRVGDHPIFSIRRRIVREAGAVVVPWAGAAPLNVDGDPVGDAPTGIEVVPDAQALPRSWWSGDASTITSADQAREAGRAWLTREQAGADQPTLRVLLDPRVQVGDIVHVEHERLGIASRARVTGLSIDLAGDVMDVTLGNRRLDDERGS